jgi:hypothetical protein
MLTRPRRTVLLGACVTKGRVGVSSSLGPLLPLFTGVLSRFILGSLDGRSRKDRPPGPRGSPEQSEDAEDRGLPSTHRIADGYVAPLVVAEGVREQIEILCAWPEQRDYELIRPADSAAVLGLQDFWDLPRSRCSAHACLPPRYASLDLH